MDEVIKAVMCPSAWQAKADAIFADITALPDKQLKIACLRKFAEKALTIDLSSPGMKNPRWTANDVNRLCREKIIYQIQKSGGTVDDAWDVLIPLLSWHRTQADKLYGDGKLPKGLTRHKNGGLIVLDHEAKRKYMERRLAYDMVASNYTVILHMTEKRFQTNEIWIWDGKIDEGRIPVLKKRLEKFLGRPMRTLEQCDKDWRDRKSQMRPWPRWDCADN
jgi:hypothetical protein